VTDAVEAFKAFLAAHTSAGGSAIDLLLATLDHDTAHLLRLAAIPHEFNARILKVLNPSLDATAREQAMAELTGFSIVSLMGDSLVIHDTARRRLFADWLSAPSEEFAAASGRLVDYYRELVAATKPPLSWANERSVMFHLLGANRPAGIIEFERLFAESRRALRFAACDTLLALVHEYDSVLTPVEEARIGFAAGKLAYDRGEYAEAVTRFRAAFAKRPEHDIELTVRMLNRLGMAYDALRAWPEALDAYGEARKLAHNARLRQQEMHILINTALALQHQGDLAQAQTLLESASGPAAESSPFVAAAVYATLGSVQRRNNDIDAALTSYARAQQLLLNQGDIVGAARVVHDIAAIYTQLGNRRKSREAYQRSLALSAGRDPLVEGRTLLNLAIDCKADHALEEAASAARSAYERFASAGVRRDMARSRRVLALVCNEQKKVEETQAALHESVALFRAVGDEAAAANVQREFAALNRPLDLPWWGWCALVLFLIGAILIITVLLIFLIGIVHAHYATASAMI
jgi:tetratricopeptide (TPR) repeat protein